jgi:hypothetical protein
LEGYRVLRSPRTCFPTNVAIVTFSLKARPLVLAAKIRETQGADLISQISLRHHPNG